MTWEISRSVLNIFREGFFTQLLLLQSSSNRVGFSQAGGPTQSTSLELVSLIFVELSTSSIFPCAMAAF